MKVERWMTSPAVTTYPEVPIYLAHRKMVEHDIRRLPVVNEDDELVGIITDRDTRLALEPKHVTRANEEIVPQEDPVLVRDCMSRAVFFVSPEDSIRAAVRIMHDQKLSGLPVVKAHRCVGVLALQDLMEVLMAALDRHLNEVNAEIRDNTYGKHAAVSPTDG